MGVVNVVDLYFYFKQYIIDKKSIDSGVRQ